MYCFQQDKVIGFEMVSGGEFLLLFYKFPTVERKFSRAEARNGVNVEVNKETSCKIVIPAASIKEGVTLRFKV
jgi:hypothetical protein